MAKAPIKAVLLMQSGFSGIGNWMADEILWRRKDPACEANQELKAKANRHVFSARQNLLRANRCGSSVPTILNCRAAWLIHQRWRRDGKCPRHGIHFVAKKLVAA